MSNNKRKVESFEIPQPEGYVLDARLRSIESDLRKAKQSNIRDWLGTLGPYVTGVAVVAMGWLINDSVTHALQREQLDLDYITEMRDLIKDYDEAKGTNQTSYTVALAMFGAHAIPPLLKRLEISDLAGSAEDGLRIIGSEHPDRACPVFSNVISDQARRFRWQTHKAMIEIIGQSSCVDAIDDLKRYLTDLNNLGASDQEMSEFATNRYSEDPGFDAADVEALQERINKALEILSAIEHDRRPWWHWWG